jgi:16S rRNA (adenine1518-N6/adenine1519-N6)-dimethyltransferase
VNHRPRRRFGQHFLESDAILDAMADRLAFGRDDDVVEIGPGEGALTRRLLELSARVTAVEIDRDLVASLRRRFPTLRVVEGDVLRVDLGALTSQSPRLVGNLPYNISTPLLLKLLEDFDRMRDAHFLLQKEVVDRLAAVPATKDWGRLSVLAQYAAVIEPLFDVGPEHFRPPPKVMSTFVRITPRRERADLKSRAALVGVLRSAFQQRRKTLRNALQSFAIDWDRLVIEPHTRPDALDLRGYIALANHVAERGDDG